MLKLTAAQKSLLNATETQRVTAALKPHNDVVQLVKDIRAVRAFRQKQRDAVGKQVRAVKKGVKAPVRQTNLNARTKQKEAIFDAVLQDLEKRLEAVHRVVTAETASAKKPKKRAKVGGPQGLLDTSRELLEEALPVLEAEARGLRESHSLHGKLVDEWNGQLTKEIQELEALCQRVGKFLGAAKKKRRTP